MNRASPICHFGRFRSANGFSMRPSCSATWATVAGKAVVVGQSRSSIARTCAAEGGSHDATGGFSQITSTARGMATSRARAGQLSSRRYRFHCRPGLRLVLGDSQPSQGWRCARAAALTTARACRGLHRNSSDRGRRQSDNMRCAAGSTAGQSDTGTR